MLKRQLAKDNNNQLFKDDALHPQPSSKHKPANLTPYLAEIQKRKKQRSQLQRSKKNVHDSSSKSFRIKDRSVTSLQKELLNRREQPKKPPLSRQNIELRPQRQRRTQSVSRHHEIQFSKTVEGKQAPTANNFFNELYSKVRNKVQPTQKERRPLRKGQFETLQDHRARSQQEGELSMYKISLTSAQIGGPPAQKRSQQQLKLNDSPAKKMETILAQNKKTNFRRNKYEAASQEVERKDTNLAANINSEMDLMAARQNEQLHKVRNRELHGSIEKSTEKYFNSGSYRPIRSKNEIQLYVSTVPNPALHKASRSTNEKSDYQSHLLVSSLKMNPVADKLLEYDFDFKNDDDGLEVLESDPESSVMDYHDHDQFQKQRKKVELQFFHKGSPRLDWSEDECKVDDI